MVLLSCSGTGAGIYAKLANGIARYNRAGFPYPQFIGVAISCDSVPIAAMRESSLQKEFRRRNLWVTDTLQWLGSRSPRTRCGIARLQLFLFVASCLSEPVCPPR